ncbi:hypothetical protein ACFVDH_28010, partial [Streptomyces sp. NPDC057674]|uniref:hypothetical protein n=1 Tax=Streptomyces sp. NPDC057674 TaxID=3346203 RepID=UPI0036A46208
MRAETVAPPQGRSARPPHADTSGTSNTSVSSDGSGSSGVPGTGARAGSSSRFAVALRAALDEIGAVPDVPVPDLTVAPLGVRDAYRDTYRDTPD